MEPRATFFSRLSTILLSVEPNFGNSTPQNAKFAENCRSVLKRAEKIKHILKKKACKNANKKHAHSSVRACVKYSEEVGSAKIAFTCAVVFLLPTCAKFCNFHLNIGQSAEKFNFFAVCRRIVRLALPHCI